MPAVLRRPPGRGDGAGRVRRAPPVVAACASRRRGGGAALGAYVEIRPGEPLDPELVRHVVELFYATGEYADVVVETVDTPGGVEVVFRPVKAPLLARIASRETAW